MSPISVHPDGNDSLTVVSTGGRRLAEYRWEASNNHPYFCHVRPTAHDGVLTTHAPYDHRWHHGIWWAWKFINDVNFWEDHPGFGGTRNGLGRSRVVSHSIRKNPATSSVSIVQTLEWTPDASAEPFLSESRLITLTESDAAWSMDWSLRFRANRDLTFSTTKYPDFAWGGYAGLNYRPARSMRDNELIAIDGDRRGLESVHGKPTRWSLYAGLVDGSGADDPEHPARGSVVIFSHRSNEWPATAYAASAQNQFGFLASAPLFWKERVLEQGSVVRLDYRMRIGDSVPEATVLDAEADEFEKSVAIS